MSSIENEVSSYKVFLKQNFPRSFMTKRFDRHRKNIEKIFQCVYMVSCIQDYSIAEDSNENLLNEYKNNLYIELIHLLYVLPIGDDYFISSIFRLISETILKIFYIRASAVQVSETEINNISHQDLWEKKIKNTDKYKEKIYNNEIIQINNMFNTNSEIMHSKKEGSVASSTYLEQFMSTGIALKKSKLNRQVNLINKFIVDKFFLLFSLNYDYMTMAQKNEFNNIFHKNFKFLCLVSKRNVYILLIKNSNVI